MKWSILLAHLGILAGSVSFGGSPELRRTLTGHTGPIGCVAFSGDGKMVASSNDSGNVRLWDVATGECAGVLYEGSDCCRSLEFSADGRILVGAIGGKVISIWDVATRKNVSTIKANESIHASDTILSVGLRPDRKSLASLISDRRGDEQAATLWDLGTGKNIGSFNVKVPPCVRPTFSPDCKTLAVDASSDKGDAVELYDVATGRKLATLKGHGTLIMNLAFSPDGKTLAAAIDEVVDLWDVETGKNTFTFNGNTEVVCGLAFSPDGKTLASGSLFEPVVRLWNTGSGENTSTLRWRGRGNDWEGVDSVAFGADGKMLAVGGGDSTIRLWSIPAEVGR